MAPFIVMLVSILAGRTVGALGIDPLDSWVSATRVGLAVMFAFTAAAHFNRLRPDLIRMVPPQLPHPELLVTVSGVAEALGAAGLLLPWTTRWAAIALAALLLALVPANIQAARSGTIIGGRPATRLLWRIPLQALWIALLLWIAR